MMRLYQLCSLLGTQGWLQEQSIIPAAVLLFHQLCRELLPASTLQKTACCSSVAVRFSSAADDM